MARKTKYSEERKRIIADEIALTGSSRSAWEKADICEETFYSWQRKYPEFSELIAIAKAEYRESCPESLRRQARRAFADYLYGRAEETWSSLERGSNDKTSWSRELTKKVRRGTPKWAIDRVLGRPQDVLEAVKTLAQEIGRAHV